MNTTTEQAMSLEEFEAKRGSHAGGVLGAGKLQRWIRDLLPLTPTQFPLDGRNARNVISNLNGTWRGLGKHRAIAMQDEKGGEIRTSVIDGELWIVWYPSTDGAS